MDSEALAKRLEGVPERIWADVDRDDQGTYIEYLGTEAGDASDIPYVRGDLYDALAAQVKEMAMQAMADELRIEIAEARAAEAEARGREATALLRTFRDAGAVGPLDMQVLKALLAKLDGDEHPMRPETDSEHIARDMREGRFPARSEPQMVLDSITLAPPVTPEHDREDAPRPLCLKPEPDRSHSIQAVKVTAYDWDEDYAPALSRTEDRHE